MKKQIKSGAGFTLIEILVVLSLLALIAILAYSYLGGVFRESDEKAMLLKAHNELKAVADAYELFYKDHGEIDSGVYNTSAARIDRLVELGYLKSAPGPPDPRMVTLTTIGFHTPATAPDTDSVGKSNLDGWVQMAYAQTQHLCYKYNEMFADDVGYANIPYSIVNGKLVLSKRLQTFCYYSAPNGYFRFATSIDSGPTP